MKDTRPLSERFDLSYVRRKHFADRFTGKAGLVCALAALGFCGVMVARSDDSPYSCGPLSRPHDMFASQCNKCHAPDMKKGRGYFLPASDDRCLACTPTTTSFAPDAARLRRDWATQNPHEIDHRPPRI